MITASNEGIYVLKKKQHKLGLPNFNVPANTTSFKTNPLTIIFYDFSI